MADQSAKTQTIDRRIDSIRTWSTNLAVVAFSGALILGVGTILVKGGWAPAIVGALVWVISAIPFAYDEAPYQHSRFAIAIFVAWSVDAVLFRLIAAQTPGWLRHEAPAIVVGSLFGGYFAWCITSRNQRINQPESNPFMWFGAFCLMIFLMFYVVSPIMQHFLPQYWMG